MEQSEDDCATAHSPVFALDLVSNRRPNANPKSGGCLQCTACRSLLDRLRHVAVAKLNEDPTRQAEIADVLLTVHQYERCTFRYIAHVMLAAQQAHKMKQAIAEMDSSTAYMIVFDFKLKFLAKGFHEGGNLYYGKKGMLWWGAGVYVKPDTWQDDRSTESIKEHHVQTVQLRNTILHNTESTITVAFGDDE